MYVCMLKSSCAARVLPALETRGGPSFSTRKVFFFEKKNKKLLPLRCSPLRETKQTKVFWFFFSKKNYFLSVFA
jgi:hypothetical protein